MGMILATIVVFLVFVVITQSASYLRTRWRVAGAEGEGSAQVRTSAAVGIASGLVVLVLPFMLYLGVTRWEWFGSSPARSSTPTFATPAPDNQGVLPIGVGPSASPAASPSH
jgi:hypothetical protein